MIWYVLGVGFGLVVMGGIWAYVHNKRNHPEKLKKQEEEVLDWFKNLKR